MIDQLSRREMLMFAAALSASGCSTVSTTPFVWPVTGPLNGRPLVDAHCHLFNASDLPAAEFLKDVFTGLHPAPAKENFLDYKADGVVDGLIQLFLDIVGDDRAPPARYEIGVINPGGSGRPVRAAVDLSAAHEVTITRLTFYLQKKQRAKQQLQNLKENTLTPDPVFDAVIKAGQRGVAAAHADVLAAPSAALAARTAVASSTDIGRYLRWFSQMTMYRCQLTEQLSNLHSAQGYAPRLLCPALVDYSEWLGEEVRSPLRDQVECMGLISRLSTGPAVHGYVAFDPLRQAFYEKNHEGEEPLALVKDALINYGFLGVKLYPPMGFKAWNNAPPPGGTFVVQEPVAKAFGPGLGEALDAALAKLYDWCQTSGVPIMAHAQNSNGAMPGFGLRADPTYWLPVFQRWPKLRVSLAHFGSFDALAAGAIAPAMPANSWLPEEATWEWAFGKALVANPNAPIYRDISYLSEVWTDDPAERKMRAGRFTDYIQYADPECKHLLFGTDWIMLGTEARVATYTQDVVTFLSVDCAIGDEHVNRILYSNAFDFLGLRASDMSRQRILAFYDRYGIPESRLPIA